MAMNYKSRITGAATNGKPKIASAAPTATPGAKVKIIVITGATGRIGKPVLERFAGLPEFRIRLIGRHLPEGFKLPKNAEFIQADLSRPADYSDALKGAVVVIHLAGLVSFHEPLNRLLEQNASNTRILASECVRAGVKKFIYASSIAVYGKSISGREIDEGNPASPTSDYGVSKLVGESEALGFKSKMKIAILRLGLVYGSGIDFGYYKMLHYIQTGKMRIVGSGENRLPFVHMDDVADAFYLAATKDNYGSGSIFNICGELRTQNECLAIASKCLGCPAPMERVDFKLACAIAGIKKALACRLGMADCKKAAEAEEFLHVLGSDRRIIGKQSSEVLGFEPQVPLEGGIAQVAKAYLKDTKGIK